jgi:hypothetical protein
MLGWCVLEGCDLCLECVRFTLLDLSTRPWDIVGGMEWCLGSRDIQDSSGKGLRTDFEGWCCRPLTKPVDEVRAGMALGDVGLVVSD